jgi:hypothetical protein
MYSTKATGGSMGVGSDLVGLCCQDVEVHSGGINAVVLIQSLSLLQVFRRVKRKSCFQGIKGNNGGGIERQKLADVL